MAIVVNVKLFAVMREKAGISEARLELSDGATVGVAAAEIGKRFPALNPLMARTSFAVNREYAKPDRALADGDELALIPAVSGGKS
jgi:molybdopterin converting factor subunit 1